MSKFIFLLFHFLKLVHNSYNEVENCIYQPFKEIKSQLKLLEWDELILPGGRAPRNE